MARAGFCSACGANVWISEDGSCANGHPASAVSGVYETGQPTPVPAPVPVPSPPKKSNTAVIVAIVLAVVVLLSCIVAGIVASVSLPIFSGASSSARQKACFSNQRMIEGAVQQYLADDPGNTSPGGPVDENSVLVTSGLIEQVPRCALGDKPYVYDAEAQFTTCPYGDPPAGHGHY